MELTAEGRHIDGLDRHQFCPRPDAGRRTRLRYRLGARRLAERRAPPHPVRTNKRSSGIEGVKQDP
jgi:hypothetical protein